MALTHSPHNWELGREGRKEEERQSSRTSWSWQARCTDTLQGHSCYATVASRIVLVPALMIKAHSSFQNGLALAARQKWQVFVSHLTGLPGPCLCSQGEKDLHCPLALLSCRQASALQKSNEEEKVVTTVFTYFVVGWRKEISSLISLQLYLDWVHNKTFCSCQDVIFLYGGCLTVQPCLDKSLT